MKNIKKLILVLLLVVVCLGSLIVLPAMSKEEDNDNDNDNGIYVSAPRLYDERTLEKMLESTKQSIEEVYNIKTDFVKNSIGKIQGQRWQKSESSFQLGGGMTQDQTLTDTIINKESNPSTTTTTTESDDGKTTQTVTNQGSSAVDTTKETKTTNKIVVNIPTVNNTAEAPKTYDSMIGMNSRDLLLDVMNLKFSAVSISYMLQKAYGDTVYDQQGTSNTNELRTVVLGLDVDIRPTVKNKDKVADISCKIVGDNVKLLQIFPRKDDYNVAAIVESTRKTGLAIPVLSIPIGFGSSKSKGESFLVKDIDTVAYIKKTNYKLSNENLVHIGWQIKPVLGRDYPNPGIRRVYFALVLPKKEVKLTYTITKKWKKIDKKTGLIKEDRNKNEISNHSSITDSLVIPDSNTIVNNQRIRVLSIGKTASENDTIAYKKDSKKMSDKPLVFIRSKEKIVRRMMYVSFITPDTFFEINGKYYPLDVLSNDGLLIKKASSNILLMTIPRKLLDSVHTISVSNKFGSQEIEVKNQKKQLKIVSVTQLKRINRKTIIIQGKNFDNNLTLLFNGNYYKEGVEYSVSKLLLSNKATKTNIQDKNNSIRPETHMVLRCVNSNNLILSLPNNTEITRKSVKQMLLIHSSEKKQLISFESIRFTE